jgi:hypothetical protein
MRPTTQIFTLTLRVASGQHKDHLGIRTHGDLVETAGARFASKIMIQGDQLGLNLFIA